MSSVAEPGPTPPNFSVVLVASQFSTLLTPLALVMHDGVVLCRNAEVFKFSSVKFDSRFAEYLLKNQAPDKVADGQAIGFGDFVDVIGRNQSAGAGHIFDHDIRVAGMCLLRWRAITRV